jgi:hypothetical protein
MTNELVKDSGQPQPWDGTGWLPVAGAALLLRPANFLQRLLAKDVGVALAILRKFNDLLAIACLTPSSQSPVRRAMQVNSTAILRTR